MHKMNFIAAAAVLLTPMLVTAALPGPWPRSRPEEAGMDVRGLEAARDFATQVEGSGFVIRRGQLVYSWGDPKKRYDLELPAQVDQRGRQDDAACLLR